MMCGTCINVMGILVLLAGISMFLGLSLVGLGTLQLAGLLFALYGLGKLVHGMGMCPACKGK